MRILKLKFEAVILADCMFLAYDEEKGIQIWGINTWWTNKNPTWLPKYLKMAAKRPKYSNILKHLKFKFKVVILTGCFICFYVCNYELFKFDIITQKQ